jgi:hypothetical protein
MAVVFPYRHHMETELQMQRNDHAEQLAHRDGIIRHLRIELQHERDELARLRGMLILPPKSVVSSPQPASTETWDGELNNLLKEEEEKANGI